MPSYPVTGIVLHRFDIGETDRVVTLLTREVGKVNAVAKGSRSPGGKLAGASELFTVSRMLVATGKSLDIVTQCEVQETFQALRTDLGLLARAAYLCELTDRLIPEHESNADVFDLLHSALYLLQRARETPDAVVHAYELRLLAERGYTPELDRCVHCGERLPRRRGGFSASLGGALCPACRGAAKDATPLCPETLEAMRQLLNSEPELVIGFHLAPVVARELAKCLKWYVRYRTERELKSLEFLEMIRRQG